eukprot:Awhi_evm1s2185
MENPLTNQHSQPPPQPNQPLSQSLSAQQPLQHTVSGEAGKHPKPFTWTKKEKIFEHNSHNFMLKSYQFPTYCDVCNKFLYGVINQ